MGFSFSSDFIPGVLDLTNKTVNGWLSAEPLRFIAFQECSAANSLPFLLALEADAEMGVVAEWLVA
jgi:hypothetical protein